MKLVSKIFTCLLAALCLTSCGLDNYDEPQSTLSGRVVYNGQAVCVRGTNDAVQVQLYQDGYEKHDPIPVYVGQDGSFKAVLFNGEYKLVTKSGNGPWVSQQDTLTINVNGSTACEITVTPYFTVTNESISLSGNMVNASATINQVVSTSSISNIILLVGKTAFVDEGTYLARKEMEAPSTGSISLSADLANNNDVVSAKALYARIGVKAAEADQYIYTPVIQLK